MRIPLSMQKNSHFSRNACFQVTVAAMGGLLFQQKSSRAQGPQNTHRPEAVTLQSPGGRDDSRYFYFIPPGVQIVTSNSGNKIFCHGAQRPTFSK
jgi:hypothetical protein